MLSGSKYHCHYRRVSTVGSYGSEASDYRIVTVNSMRDPKQTHNGPHVPCIFSVINNFSWIDIAVNISGKRVK